MFCKNPYQTFAYTLAPDGTRIKDLSNPILCPCRKCIICRVKRRQEWTTRLLLEAMDYTPDKLSFLTLTYNNENLTDLNKRDLQLFLKRLRKRLDVKIRYFACGEYGEKSGRPHYHLIIFGAVCNDEFKRLVDDCWGFGFTYTKNADIYSFKYVAGYVLKKQANKITNEFILVSRRPGLGCNAAKRYFGFNDETGTDVLNYFILDGKKYFFPKILKQKMRELRYSPEYIEELKHEILQEYLFKLLSEAWQVSDDKDIYSIKRNLKYLILKYHEQSNANFISISNIKKLRKEII